MKAALALLALLLGSASLQAAEPPPELELAAEFPVEGMAAGNLSGLSRCAGDWLAVSDRDDQALYRLSPGQTTWQAHREPFNAGPPPAAQQPWGLRARGWLSGLLRGGELDFEGLSCDARGNRWLVSETHNALLHIDAAGQGRWQALPAGLIRQARASGLLLRHNAQLEGLALSADGQHLWLAAEREQRGLLALQLHNGRWQCAERCILLSEGGLRRSPLDPASDLRYPRDFADLALFGGKLFSLQRLEHLLCRRDPDSGALEKCWSFASHARRAERRYASPYGHAEALWLDGQHAWLGLDNNGKTRQDGEQRPLIWQLQAPTDGWLAP